jgi:hypothetical protein
LRRSTIISALALAASSMLLFAMGDELLDASPADRVTQFVLDVTGDNDLVVLNGRNRSWEVDRFAPRAAVATDRAVTDVTRFRRVVVVSHESQTSTVVERALDQRGFRLWERRIAGERIAAYEVDVRDEMVARLPDLVLQAQVSVIDADDQKVADCPMVEGRFRCPGPDWVWVGPISQTIDGQLMPCVWSHPPEAGSLRIELPPMPGGTSVAGWIAQSDYAVGLADGAPVDFEIAFGSGTQGFKAHRMRGRIDVSVANHANAQAPVILKVTSRKPGARHFCWDLSVVRRIGGDRT